MNNTGSLHGVGGNRDPHGICAICHPHPLTHAQRRKATVRVRKLPNGVKVCARHAYRGEPKGGAGAVKRALRRRLQQNVRARNLAARKKAA